MKHIKLYEDFNQGHPGFFTTKEETETWLIDMEIENFINGVLDKKHIDSTPVWMN